MGSWEGSSGFLTTARAPRPARDGDQPGPGYYFPPDIAIAGQVHHHRAKRAPLTPI